MLSSLTIKDFAIIDRVTLELGPGLTVITGETGAGKSILIDALNLILGGRASTEVIRTGADAATVEALFELDPATSQELRARLAVAGVDDAETAAQLVVRRVVSRTGRHRVYLNDALVTLSTLAEVAGGLVDISGQHEHYSLLRPEFHLELLDRMGGLAAERAAVATAHGIVADVDARLAELREAASKRGEREGYLTFQLQELTAANLKDPAEEETIEQERTVLRNAEKLRSTARQAENALYAGDGAATEGLARAARAIRELATLDPSLGPVADDLETASALAEDSARALSAYARRVHADPERLEQIEERLALFARLRRKHGATLTEIIARRESIAAELALVAGAEESATQLEAARDKAAAEMARAARTLTEARRRAAASLCKAIQAELADLGMGRAVLEVRLTPLGTGTGLRADGLHVSARGAEKVEFLMSANPGEAPGPLSRIASGGELSRFMLAVKRVIAARDPVGTYVFDEVDSGVGGPTAEAIGRKLGEVSAERQALCITHLPQIAAFGRTHLHVEKHVEDGRTVSKVRLLEGEDRVHEIARMLGGTKVGEATVRLAREMLAG
jgi:DNA repair protein RecN (Recombination protein N)